MNIQLITVLMLIVPIQSDRLYGIVASVGEDQRRMNTLVLKRIAQCEDFQNLPVYVPDSRIVLLNSTHYVISGVVRFHQAYRRGIKVSVWIEQCNGTELCKPFTGKVQINDACALFDQSNPAIESVIKYAKPTFKCPFEIGLYRFNDVILNSTIFR